MTRRGLARSRSDARRLVRDGKVTVGGTLSVKAGAQVDSRGHASVEQVGGPFPLIVGDPSFISLCLVAAPLAGLALSGAALLLLVKPQFEAGRGNLGGGGVVRDPRTRETAVRRTVSCLDAEGIDVVAMTTAAVSGDDGNREVFALRERGAPAVPVEVPE